MIEYFRRLFESSDFMPHGHCYFWKSEILWPTILGDGLTGMAYFTLPFLLFYIVKKRADLVHRNIFILFGIFIMACGTTHFVDIWTIWFPTYRLASIVALFTGCVSVLAAATLFKALPQILTIASNHQLQSSNAQLTSQIAEREKAQAELQQLNGDLEGRVQQRTAQLIKANRELEREIEVRKKAERDLMLKNGELIRINGDLDNFVYCASHDLKSPVVNAEGLITALREELAGENTHVTELINRLDKSIESMYRTIQDLTEVSTLQKSTVQADFKILSLSEVIEEVKADLTDEIAKANVRLETDFEAADQVWFTHRNLKSIVYNLLSNAIKYRSPDRVPSVKLTSAETDQYTILTVADNGIGIDLIKHEKKIFSLFKRLHDNIEGSGVGLFIVKRIMDNNQGRVEVESKLGEGTAFKIYFPKRKVPNTQEV